MSSPLKLLLAQAMVGIMQNQADPINRAKLENWESYSRKKSKKRRNKAKIKQRKRNKIINRKRNK